MPTTIIFATIDMKKTKLRQSIRKCLKEYGIASTIEILAWINENTRQGSSAPELGNVLHGSPDEFRFVRKKRVEKPGGRLHGTCLVCLWKNREGI